MTNELLPEDNTIDAEKSAPILSDAELLSLPDDTLASTLTPADIKRLIELKTNQKKEEIFFKIKSMQNQNAGSKLLNNLLRRL